MACAIRLSWSFDASRISSPGNFPIARKTGWPTEFAPKMRIARGDLEETRDHLRKAIRVRYVSEAEGAAMIELAGRSLGASTRFVEYLETKGEEWKKAYRWRIQHPEPAGPGT